MKRAEKWRDTCYNNEYMRIFRIQISAAPLLILTLLTLAACDNVDLGREWAPPIEAYEVSAYIQGVSLNRSSIVKRHDTIIPYFTHSLANDLDVWGLLVFFRTPAGKVVGRKTRYEIQNTPGLRRQEAPVDAPAYSEPFGGSSPDPAPPLETDSTPEVEPPPIMGEPPATHGEPPPVEAAPLPPVEEGEKIEKYEDRIIPVDRLDKECPPFTLTEAIPIGYYFMVFQVLGGKDTLYQVERPVFFLGDAEIVFDDIRYYLPGLSSNAYFVPQGIDILITALVNADSRLDPYIVWYAGKKPVGEGRAADIEAGDFIWKVPDQTGFHTIRAELFPFKPPEGAIKARGMEKELSLPVSSKSVVVGYFTDIAGSLSQWYQFQRDLRDSKREDRALRSLDRKEPRWMTSIGLYGLLVGTGNRYRLADNPFAFGPDEQARGKLVFHLSTADDGTIFVARLKTFDQSLKETPDPVILRMSLLENALVLTLEYRGAALREAIGLDPLEPKRLMAPRLDITLSRYTVGVELNLENAISRGLALSLPVAVNGEGDFDLGEKTAGKPAVTAIVDELGLGFEKIPAPGGESLPQGGAE